MIYKKSSGTQGAWLDKKTLETGMSAVIVSEIEPMEREYQGKPQIQDVGKVRVEGNEQAENFAFNRTTINGLIEAFGEENTDWCNKELKVQVENAVINNKRVRIVYLIPEGYELKENEDGYLGITKA